ncbi:MAG: PaaI family thioesterase [Oscillospiraceae bacterium]|jgi:acyl-CoA thioesterase|nr:PaaI family thioesterase [Oscillospiraceae bacterium]
MNPLPTLDEIRKFFANDRFAASAGIVIDDVTEEHVTCSLPLTAEHSNAAGGVQGGAIFTLADLAFAVHCNFGLLRGEDVGVTVGQSCSISFLKAPKGKTLTARSTQLSRGRNMSVFRIEISDELGNAVAEMHGNAFTTAKKL